jgi:hypothetical protein
LATKCIFQIRLGGFAQFEGDKLRRNIEGDDHQAGKQFAVVDIHDMLMHERPGLVRLVRHYMICEYFVLP